MLPRNYHENRKVEEVSFQVLYTRHSLTLLAVSVLYVLFYAFNDQGSYQRNLNNGAFGLCFLTLVIGSMIFPSGPFIRPHPLFWRIIFTISVIYMGGLMFLVFLTPDQMREGLKIFDEKMGVKLPSKNYADDCGLTIEAFSDKFDIFIIAHFLGWVLKAVVLRDRMLLWVCSILWEFVEISTAYFIPNFAECWWDQWILDVLLCNGLGIEFGLWYLRTFETNNFATYDWVPFLSIEGVGKKAQRTFKQFFTPEHVEPFEWEHSDNFKRLLYYTLNILVACIVDMNIFLLKLWLWIPTDHPLCLFRTFLMGLCCLVTARQFYFFVSDTKCDYIGSQTWVCLMILFLELCISIKCAPSPMPAAPLYAKLIWAGAAVIWGLFGFLAMQKWKKAETGKKEN